MFPGSPRALLFIESLGRFGALSTAETTTAATTTTTTTTTQQQHKNNNNNPFLQHLET